ncbi:MAG: alkaline phosphatase family protein [Lachnospiraceae bacterium]
MNTTATTQKLLVLGIDGMDARTTARMVKEGKLPNVQTLLTRGSARADLQLLGALPTITPPCWTTLATGAYPGTHGITCYWRQSPDSLDAVVYNMDSRHCTAEQIWNVTAAAGKKTLVWHWPGSSWPPSSPSPQLSVVDGTQPGSVNMGIAQMDWEKIITASASFRRLKFIPHTKKNAGVGCNITDLEELIHGDESSDEMMELWWGDAARTGVEIRTYVDTLEDTEMMIGAKVAYDDIYSPIRPAADWAKAPAGAKEFTIVTSSGALIRPALILQNADGVYDRIAIYKDKTATQPIVTVQTGELSSAVDEVIKQEVTKPAMRSYKLLSLAPDGSDLRLWISNALDITNDTLWSPRHLLDDVTTQVGPVPPVSLIGGEDSELVEQVFLPSWEQYNTWQANALNSLIHTQGYEAVFTHLHNVDCAGHQLWHLAKTLPPWAHTDEKKYQALLEEVYLQTDAYIGEFLPLLDKGFTILLVSDHGLLVGENVPPLLGEYGGLNIPVMETLGYTVMKRDADGKRLSEVDWEKTRAVQIRSNYIYLNLKGRDATGIVAPEDAYALEEQIISDLYNYRDPATGKRVVGIALRNKDAVVLGVDGPESGDIFFTIEEGFNRLHGDGLSTAEGYFDTSVTPVFIAAGNGIKKSHTTQRVIRQVDVAPTVSALLGVAFTAQCEGAPVYQILQS